MDNPCYALVCEPATHQSISEMHCTLLNNPFINVVFLKRTIVTLHKWTSCYVYFMAATRTSSHCSAGGAEDFSSVECDDDVCKE